MLHIQGNYIQGISLKMDWMPYAMQYKFNSENEECMKVVKLFYKDLKMFQTVKEALKSDKSTTSRNDHVLFVNSITEKVKSIMEVKK